MNKTFKAMVVSEVDGKFVTKITERKTDDLPKGDVLIKVKYSSLNYKDALSAAGNKGVTRKYPHTPGIDAAGIVAETQSNKFKDGDEVLVTGYDLGMNTSGGFAEYIRVPADWVVKLPVGLSLKESMILGTAGFTAGLAMYKLELCSEEKIDGEVLVTGATGGVGSLAVALLSKNGHHVVASTGKKDKANYLKILGVKDIIGREELDNQSEKPLLNRRWKAAVDTVGGNILATVIKQMDYRSSVASCGNVLSPELNTTVFPFILRGVNLLGINSAETPMELRVKIWQKLAAEWKLDCLNKIFTECPLEQLNEKIDLILQGQISGRVIVKI
ncbi:MAG: YhdH/YhfP family quinone oxidoreductase [Ignavibacteriaceae bacterium]|nr:YhdH/YhfP family quinone oxidoreductase [Ignavibacteriaceae bacterium]